MMHSEDKGSLDFKKDFLEGMMGIEESARINQVKNGKRIAFAKGGNCFQIGFARTRGLGVGRQ